MKFFARKQVDFPDDEIKRLRSRLAEAEGRISALEEKAERVGFLEAVIQGVAEPILVIDRNYNIILKNPAADGFWGIPKDGKIFKCHEVLHGMDGPCEKKDWPCPLRQVLETGKPVTVQHEHRTESGVRLYELLASPLVLSGELIGIIETARDVTESLKSELFLRESEERFRSLFENSMDAIIVSSPEGRNYAANPAACRMLGYTEEELIKVGRDGIVDKFDPNLPGYLEERASKGKARAELTLVRKDGTRFLAEVSAAVFTDREGRQRASVIMRDITERKALERQRSDFLAMVTHDLKSPLTAILGYSELIKDECERRGDEGVREMAEAVEQGGHKLLRLVEDFLTVSRMETENLELKKAPADIREVLEKVEEDFYLQAKNSGIALSVGLPQGPMPQPYIDRPQVERLLGNLVQNAINYTPTGGSISIGAEESVMGDRRYIKVSVSDTGRGIPKEEQGKVFSKYYRSSRTAGIKGSGLGLTIAKAIAEAHGGWIELESEQGKGSTFSLFLPV